MPGTNLGKAFVQIVPSAEGISGSLDNIFKGEASSAGTNAGKMLVGKLKGVLAGAAVGAALKKTLDVGGALEQSFGGLDTIYGDAAEKAKEYAKQAYQAGISTNSFAEQAVSFGASLKQAYEGDTAKAVEAANTAILDMTDNAAKMGTPIESIQNAYQGFAKQNYTMLDNLKLGYGGTKQEMERLLADAQKISGVEYNIDNLGDVYEAIHVIQGDLGLTGVAAQEAAETFSGSFAAMKAAGENLMGSLMLGEDIGPAMENLVTTASTFLFNNLLPAIGRILGSLPSAIGTAIETGAPIVWEKLSALVQTLPGKIQETLPLIAEKGREIILNLGTAIRENLPTMAASAAEAISQFGQYLAENLPQLAAKGGEILGQIIGGIINHLPEILSTAGKILSFLVKGILGAYGTLLSAGGRLIGGIAKGIIGALKSTVGAAMDKVKSALTEPIDKAKELIGKAIEKIKSIFNFKVELPHVKLPHFSVSGSANPVKWITEGVPKLHVEWYKKAETNPYLFGDATLFGAGESNDEILYGRRALMRDISDAVGGGRSVNVTNYITVDGAEDPEDFARRLIRRLEIDMRAV